MAECVDSLRFLLILFSILPLSHEVKIQNARNVAPDKKGTLASSVSGWDNMSSSVDGDLTTCAKTSRELKPWWAVDLGANNTYTIVGLRINTGDNVLEHIEIWVGPNPGTSSGNAYCNRHLAAADQTSEINVTCVQPISGRYVTITVLEHAYLGLCEVNIYECLEGFFGKDCSQECHCSGGPAACPRLTGECACAAGWKGRTCQTNCEAGQFGESCLNTCHCKDGKTCNGTTGECPTEECMDNWVGQSCQTEIPDMGDQLYRPIAVEKTSRTITLEWRGWEKFVDSDSMLVFWIEYKPYRVHKPGMTTFEPNWMRTRVHVSATGDQYQRALVADLTTNTNYLFRVVPYIQIPGEAPIQGQPTPDGGPYKTRCTAIDSLPCQRLTTTGLRMLISYVPRNDLSLLVEHQLIFILTDPDPPMIRHIEPIVDKTTDPPKALFNVKWQAPSRHFVHCDNIKYFKISYQAETGAWKSLLASNRMQSKNITNVRFNVRYNVKVTAVNNEDFISESPVEVGLAVPEIDSVTLLDERSKNNGVVTATIVTLLVVIVICLAGFLLYRRRTKYSSVPIKDDKSEVELPSNNANATVVKGIHYIEIPEDSSNSDMNDSGVVDGSASENTPSSVADTLVESTSSNQEEKNPFPRVVQPDVDRSIVIEDLEQYVMSRKQNDCEGLRKEYEEIPMGFIDRYDHGRLSENKHKNRFINIIAYDHSRVVLDKVDGDPDSDYINANWIDGYRKPRDYVAAQGCNKYTIQDMWRMVWQLKSGRIIMVTNLVENGKRKCDQYWPDEGEKSYNGIEVRIVDTERTSDFIIRSFELQKGEEKRSVKQFHFIAWPDHGVPNRAGPIIAFRRKVRSYDESHGGPMLIHCSAGVGRTGTFIALDYLLDRAKVEHIVDIYGLVWDMRRNRVNMIQTVEQYIFVYDALLEALKAGNTAIGCSEFREQFAKLKAFDEAKQKSPLQEQYETLQLMSPKVRPEDCKSGSLAENIDKNRFKEILPADRHRPYLMVRVEGTNDYINAVFLDGFLKRNSYIITQMPLPHTVIDFWRMVYEHGCNSIVMLNSMEDGDETYGQYWLDEEGCECGPFVIEPVSTDPSHKDVTVRELKLSYEPQSPSVLPNRKEEKPRMIGQFHLKTWPREGGPNSKAGLIHLIELVERWQQKTGDGPVLVHCHDGVTKSGLFTAVSCIWEKMKVDQEVDIFHAVKHLRYHRPQIVMDMEQYEFCYEMVLAYMTEFETYANFR